jgi:hypothetical protein
MERNDWFFGKFEPEYQGDTPNRKWVRDKLEEKGTPTDITSIIKVLPEQHIQWIFDRIVQHSYFGIEG